MSQHNFTKVFAEDGRQIGVIQGDTFIRRFRAHHVLKYPEPALCIGEHALEQLQAAGVAMLEYRNVDTGEVYRASLSHFLEASRPIDRGHGRQRALALNGWMRARYGAQLALFAAGGAQ